MKSAKSAGRIVGMLLLLHLAAGLTIPFILLTRVIISPGFRASAAFLFVVGSWIFLLCSVLCCFKLVPRVLAAFGLVGAMLQITGVTLRGFWGISPKRGWPCPWPPPMWL